MKVDVLLGLQWGDEGKGKIVDVLAPRYDVIARFQGGPNAGHTLEFNGIKEVLHTIPSGIFHKKASNLIGNGVIVDPVILRQEIDKLSKYDNKLTQRLYISKKTHLILPTHRLLDKAKEIALGEMKIGSTQKGIGPTYIDKTGRLGLRVGDLFHRDFNKKYACVKEQHMKVLSLYGISEVDQDDEAKWIDAVEYMKTLQVVDSEFEINQHLQKGNSILAEGAQGSMLDVDFGTYPYVTSSNTITAGACTGLGLAPSKIGEVLGIFKAYCTRVGSGPFPTELNDNTGEFLRKQGHEFGATTGRPRRCGWLDLVALRYANMINGTTRMLMTKADVMDTMDEIKVCVAYKINGKETKQLPYELTNDIEPIYKTFPGWKKSISNFKMRSQLPSELLTYIDFIEQETGVPVWLISTGPDRTQIIGI